ncbi:MAG: nucleotidyltransferase domain-containing protein [Cyclobacteriaceae bacterium]|nr:MAG: nucleotidyltransferase domain-containing protein [Cyclobacteriaceae bacterium]
MTEAIHQRLDSIRLDFRVNILHACESGSRAWGFASPDSDYDVRFIYIHKRDHYLSIDEPHDVIELPISDLLDINGWELRKALRLFRKSNAPLYEWLQSPIVYQSDPDFIESLRGLMSTYFSPRAMMHHYLSMVNNVMNNDLSGIEVKLKKYFYALRPILASRWIAEYNEVPPMEFAKLRVLLDKDLHTIIDDLLAKKATVDEKFAINPIMEIHRWLDSQLAYCESRIPDASRSSDSEPLNELFRKFIL